MAFLGLCTLDQIYAEMAGYGMTSDASHITAPDPSGEGAARCMIIAMKDAKVRPEEVDYINAHGSSTKMNDIFETSAYKTIFGDYAYKLPMSSLKSMIGHPLAAANAIELTICSMIFERNLLPPTINQEEADPLCDLNYIPNTAIAKKVNTIMKTSSGFSGIHSSLILKRF